MTKTDGRKYAEVTPEQFRHYLPLACAWAAEQERFILENGAPLTAAQMLDAELACVAHPERIRLLAVKQMPLPAHPILQAAAEATKLITPQTAGLALRYGIFIRLDYWGQRRLQVHEFAHTAQYERLGGLCPFLECYLYECLVIGYHSAPMEREAIAVADRICGQAQSSQRPGHLISTGSTG
jgi:hypothetical protein